MNNVFRTLALAGCFFPAAALSLHAKTAEAAPAAAPRNGAVCASLRIDGAIPADVRAVERGIGEMLGCKNGQGDSALAFWSDTASPSQLARLAVVADCLPEGMDRPRDLVEALRCHPDLALLDRVKLDGELEADPRFDAAAKATIRETFERTRAKIDTWTKQANALAATSPEARAVLFDAPRRAASEWATAYAANKDGVDAAFAFTSKIGTDAARGCSTPMRQHLAAYLAKKSAKTAAAAATALSEPTGYAIADALAQCEQLDGEPLAAQALSSNVLAKTARWHRGPRVAAYWAGIDAIEASDAAQRFFGATFGVFRKLPRPSTLGVPRPAQEREQVIASVKPAKTGGALVTFEGSSASVFVATSHTSGLAAGRKLVFLQDGARAFPTSVFADKDKKTAVAFMGAALPGAPTTPSLPSPPPSASDKKVRRIAHR